MTYASRIFGSLLLFAAASLTTAHAAHAQSVQRDIPYTIDSTGIYHGDLYRPASPTLPPPAILLIHGGAWRSGHKKEMARLATDLSAHGYVCFSIDYDVHPHSFPISWQEARAAVDYMRRHAAEFGLDPNRVAVLGTSAGGEIASLLALEPSGPSSDNIHRGIPLQAAVTLNGGYDAHVNNHSPLHGYVIKRYLGAKCEAAADLCDDASPTSHVSDAEVPFFVGHGNHDHLIPFTQATAFIDKLHQQNDPVTPFVADGGGHNYWRKKQFYAANLAAVLAFLDDNLRKA